ncbi:OmpA family protein [Chromobacterium amazonense]|uniref:OmpA family protein n=1 Tax=Chromobacterium amazonense TaxID=1382803 RepID=UPI003F79E8CA
MKRLLTALFVTALCAACATPKKAEPTPSQAAQAAAAANDPKAQIAKQAAVNYAADATLIPFDKMSAKLSPVGEAQLDLLVTKDLKNAKSILVRGHCYRRDIGNAKAAAQTRAVSVRQYLVDAGVPPSKITMRYDTERSLHAVRLVVSN